MASLHSSPALRLHHHHHTSTSSSSSPALASKSRTRSGGVKPILKKLHSSHSEKNSLDLDRGWEEQTVDIGYYGPSRDDDGLYAADLAAGNTRLTRDVSFTLSATDLPGLSSTASNNNKYSHARSLSGASHGSVATNGSGLNGSFVHPFQQTPRTSTPPLSYANSFVSLDNTPAASRDYSPTITEDEFDYDPKSYVLRAPRPPYQQNSGSNASTSSSFAKHRASSLTDINKPQRIYTSRASSSTASSQPLLSVSQSRPDYASTASTNAATSITSPSINDSLLSPSATSCTSPPSTASPLCSPSNAMSPTIRSSLDGFRLRSRSELDTATRQEQVRQARRKFEQKEKVKEEKYAREQVRKREKADTKEAQRYERAAHSQLRSTGRTSSSIDIQPAISRKSTSNGRFEASSAEKLSFTSHGYDSAAQGQLPNARAEDVHFQSTHRPKTAKHKTMSTWTAFVLWFRTRLLKMGKR
jgi:hypothetical protein